jgi:hypothetical protein
MLDSFEKEIIQVGEQNHENKEETSANGKGLRSDKVSSNQSDIGSSEENSESEVDESSSASEDDKPLFKSNNNLNSTSPTSQICPLLGGQRMLQYVSPIFIFLLMLSLITCIIVITYCHR